MLKMNLKEILEQRSITQKTLAKMVDISEAKVSHYCNNKFQLINKDHLERICGFLNCGIEELLVLEY